MVVQARLVSPEPWRRRLYLPAYSVADAARYAGTHPQTVAYWHYRGDDLGPAIPGKERKKPLSWLQLVEVAFVATFRRVGVSLQRIRKARQYLAQMFEAEFPFAQLDLKTEGVHVLMELQEIEPDSEIPGLIVADAGGQLAWQRMVADRFLEFDYEKGLALRWHVAGRQSPVLLDPRVSFGAPSIRGVPTWTVKGRWLAGESVSDIGEDFTLDTEDVLAALGFERIKAAA